MQLRRCVFFVVLVLLLGGAASAYAGLQTQPASRAVPAAAAEPSILDPLTRGRFVRADERAAFELTVRNTGDAGADTYDIQVTSTWPVALYQAAGITPLVDTDGDGVVDTGSLAPGTAVTVVATIATPAIVNVGDSNQALVAARSSLDAGQAATATLSTAIPASFVQVFRDGTDGAMRFAIVEPEGETVRAVTPEGYDGLAMAVAAGPYGYVYAWSRYMGTTTDGGEAAVIEYAVLDHAGHILRPPTVLVDYDPTAPFYDTDPVIAIAPNGSIGVAWLRFDWVDDPYVFYTNVHFAVLDVSGSLIYGPENVTNHRPRAAEQPYRFWSWFPSIAATEDDHFVLAWERYQGHEEPYNDEQDVYYAVRDTDGEVVNVNIAFADGAEGNTDYSDPTLASLNGNRVLLAYQGPGSNTSYGILDSTGSVLRSQTVFWGNLSHLDAVQLSEDTSLIAGWYGGMEVIVLDHTEHAPVSVTRLSAAPGDDISVLVDGVGRGVLTWMADDVGRQQRHLYYALLDNSGNVLTEPMIFRTAQAADQEIEMSYVGAGNAPYAAAAPTTPDVDAWVAADGLAAGSPGGVATLRVGLGNRGGAPAISTTLTATLGGALGYVGGAPAPSAVVGDTVTWALGDLAFQGYGYVRLTTTVPSTTVGTRHPITWTLASAGPDADPRNNTAITTVMVARQAYLPLIAK
jgi:hypothetical protein